MNIKISESGTLLQSKAYELQHIERIPIRIVTLQINRSVNVKDLHENRYRIERISKHIITTTDEIKIKGMIASTIK